MTKLEWDFRQICEHRREGSYQTRHDRQKMLFGIARDLRQLGFRDLRATGSKPKHFDALVKD